MKQHRTLTRTCRPPLGVFAKTEDEICVSDHAWCRWLQAIENMSTTPRALTYEGVLRDMVQQIREFQKRPQLRSCSGGYGGQPGALITQALSMPAASEGANARAFALCMRANPQTPQLSSDRVFELSEPMLL